MSEHDIFPVGAVIAAGGTLPESPALHLCDGRSLAVDDYRELYDVLRDTYGSSGPGRFRLPDYRGLFLRGRRDGAPIGVLQDWATGTPATPFKGTMPHFPTETWTSHLGSRTHFSERSETTLPVRTCTAGGDRETRPVNVYVNYYIKVLPAAV